MEPNAPGLHEAFKAAHDQRRTSTMSKPCIFCGRTDKKITGEHVFGDWISELFGRDPTGTIEIGGPNETKRSLGGTVFQQTVRAPCEVCNSGWMSAMEGAVKPILGPMMLQGLRTPLPPRVQQQLAAWAVKMALMLDELHRSAPVIPRSEYPAFYAAKHPLPGQGVVIAHRANFNPEPERELLASALKGTVSQVNMANESLAERARSKIPEWKADGRNIYAITFTVGHVVFQVFGHNTPIAFQVNIDAPVANLIWPVQAHVTWPPGQPIAVIGGLRYTANSAASVLVRSPNKSE